MNRNSLETSADNQPFHLPLLGLHFNRPSQRTLLEEDVFTSSYHLFTSLKPQLRVPARAEYS